jgi:outer membrane protein TolC
LLRGFGIGVNRRYIHIARNDEKISDLLFQQQVIATVAGVIRLYTDLVSLIEDVQVKQETLALSQRLYQDNKEKVDQGTLAPIEVVRAQAQIAASRQDLANSQGFELQQELLVKTVLTRRGTADPLLRDARIVATTPIDVPATEDIRPVQDLVTNAFSNRPELQEARLQIANSELYMKGSKNALLPQVDILASAQNSGLAGALNPLASTSNTSTGSAIPDQTFVGGFGSSLAQVFQHNYPTYAVGIQLNLPIHNRVAEGDYVRDELQYRQTQIRQQQLENQVRLEVEGALIALQQSRAAYDASLEARKLQEQSLQIEMEKYENGISTPFLVQQYQSYVAQARSTEVAARGTYAKAKTELERTIGLTLPNHNVEVDEVMKGKITTPPAALPPLPGTNGLR